MPTPIRRPPTGRTQAARGRPQTLHVPRDREGRFVNWAGTVIGTPSSWREPRTDEEVEELVRSAARSGRRVRVVGAGHSWSSIAAPEDIAVLLDGLSGIVSLDRDRELVTVRGGTRLQHLNDELDGLGLALPIVGSIAHQSIAGATATGTHGSSLTHGNLASLVSGMRLVDGRGETHDLAEGDPRLDGARVHLGALGVVTRLALRVERSFRVAETIESVPLGAAVAALEDIARSAEYVKVWWMPHTPTAQIYRCTRTREPMSTRPSPATQRWIDDMILQRRVFPWVAMIQRIRPRWIPRINQLVSRTFVKPRRIGQSSLMLSTPYPLIHRETEAAMPLERGGEAFERVVRLVEREGLRLNFPVEVRFVREDAGWMSPAHGQDTCQLGAYATRLPDTERFFSGFWREMRALGARPHWGKEHDHARGELRLLYPLFDRFVALRDQLDPGRTFASAFHARALGP